MIPWTVAHQAIQPLGFPRQDYWSWFQFPSPSDWPDPGTESVSSALVDGFFTTEPSGGPYNQSYKRNENSFRLALKKGKMCQI